jgi:hypothetical protein
MAMAGIAIAQPRAELQAPIAAKPIVWRAQIEEVPADPARPTNSRKRESVGQYPPTYSSGRINREFPQMTGMWKRVVGSSDSDDSQIPAENPAFSTPVSSGATRSVRQQPIVNTTSAPQAKQKESTTPAWKWYGYGAPLPGSNSLAPTGRYGAVQPSWYTQTGATPGAVPRVGGLSHGPSSPTQPNHAPVHNVNEPPVQPIGAPSNPDGLVIPADALKINGFQPRQADLDMPMNGPKLDSEKPASIGLPIKRQVSRHESEGAPASSHDRNYTSRAQAPEAELIPPLVIAALKTACTGHASKIGLIPKGPRQIGLNLTVIPGIPSDLLAERIAKLPELDGWDIEMTFAR